MYERVAAAEGRSPSLNGGTASDKEHPFRVVRNCTRCSRPLSVGERMFYFLDAINDPTLCRVCITDEARVPLQSTLPKPPAPVARPPVRPLSWVPPARSGATATGSQTGVPTLEEDFLRIDLAICELPSNDRLVKLMRDLELEAKRRWEQGRFADARRIVERLQAKLGEMHFLRSPPPARMSRPLGVPAGMTPLTPAPIDRVRPPASAPTVPRLRATSPDGMGRGRSSDVGANLSRSVSRAGPGPSGDATV